VALIPGNLLSENNQSVETSIGGWASFLSVSSGIVQSVTQHFDGTHSAASTANAGTAGALGGLVNTVDLPVVRPGTAYEYSYFVFSPKRAIFNANLDWYQANNTTFVSSVNSPGQEVPVNTWTKITGGAVAPALSGLARCYLQVTSGLAAADVVFFDQMFFGWPLAADLVPLFRPEGLPWSRFRPWEGAPDGIHNVIVNAGVASVTFLTPSTRLRLLLALTSESGQGATVTTFNDVAPLGQLLTPDDPLGGMQPWTGAPDSTSPAATVAAAGMASVTFTGLTASAGLGALPGTGSVTFTGQQATAGLIGQPGNASVALSAQGPTAGLGALPGTALVSLTGLNATTALSALPGTASVTTAVQQETTALGTFPGVAPVSLTALSASTVSTEGVYDPSPVLFLPDDPLGGMQPWTGAPDSTTPGATTATAGTASVSLLALAPAAGLSALPGTGSVTLTGQGPVVSLGALPGTGAFTLTAQTPSVALSALPGTGTVFLAAQTPAAGLSALPGTASITTAVQQDVPGFGALPGTAPVAFLGQSATISTLEDPQALPIPLLTPDDVLGGMQPWAGASQGIVTGDMTVLAGTAVVSVTAQGPSTALSVGTGTGTVSFTAQSPSAAFSGTATPGTATVTLTAAGTSPALAVLPGTAASTLSARSPAAGLGALPGSAALTLTAYGPTITVPQAAHGRTVSGCEPVSTAKGKEPDALLSGREPSARLKGKEPVSSRSGNEPDNTIKGREG
jgi:hypothetical protein